MSVQSAQCANSVLGEFAECGKEETEEPKKHRFKERRSK